MSTILLAEDDAPIREGLVLTLKSEGYAVRAAANGAEALALFAEARPDLLLLDVMMPKKSGWDVCAEVRRADPSVPILFLTAKAEERDKVLGLGLGADDYIVKPFGVPELLARVAAALRRAAAAPPQIARDEPFAVAGARVDPRALHLVDAAGRTSDITSRELALLRLFAARPGEALPRDRLLNEGWGVDYLGTTRTLDQLIVKLRRKLGPDASALETIHGVGYRLRQ